MQSLRPNAVIQTGLFYSGKVDEFKDRVELAKAIEHNLLEYLNNNNVAIANVNGALEFVRIKFDDQNRIWK